MPYEPPPELAGLSLAQIAELVAARKLPPVAQWDPPETIDSQMRIAADGHLVPRRPPDHPPGDGARLCQPAAARC